MFNYIDAYVTRHNLIQPEQTIVVGLSGGPDSVLLLRYLHARAQQYNLNLIAAHLDHGWRVDSAEDAAWCQQLCDQLKIRLIVTHLRDIPACADQRPSEALGRKARRIVFERIAHEHHADAIALAHHEDDQQETFFIRMMRGTSLTGLCSMRANHGQYIRPLLCVSKEMILAYLHTHGYEYRIDPTNASDQYLRNRIRNQLLPIMHQLDNRWQKNFASTLENLQETEQFLHKLTYATFTQIAQRTANGRYQIALQALRAMDPVMQYRLLVHWLTIEKVPFPATKGFLDELLRFINQPHGGVHNIHTTWKIYKKKESIWIDASHKFMQFNLK